MSKELWIFAEQIDGQIAPSYYEMLSKAKALYASVPQEPCYTVVYFSADGANVKTLEQSGADKVIAVVHEGLKEYNPVAYAETFSELAGKFKPETIFIASTAVGSELAPSVAAKLNTGLIAHCTELRLDKAGQLHLIVPAFGGKLMGENIIPNHRPVMASIKPGIFEKETLEPRPAQTIYYDAEALAKTNTDIEFVGRTVIESEELPVENAEIVVCAGFGVAASESLEKVREFASRIGAALAYTRPLVDLDYFPNENSMVGTSGKTIKPKLYIGFGISGASHHVCGMKDSGVIININNDDTASCFDISNYKVVDDCGAIVQELLAQIGS